MNPQKVSILTLLVPGLNIDIGADGMSKLPRLLALIFITSSLLQAEDILIVFMPTRANKKSHRKDNCSSSCRLDAARCCTHSQNAFRSSNKGSSYRSRTGSIFRGYDDDGAVVKAE